MKDYPEFKNGGYAKQGYYIVSSMTPRTGEGNGDCCWMNVDVHRLEQAALRDRQYVFDAYINGNRYIYSCPAKALNKIVPLFLTPLTRENGTQEWKLFVDYKLGEVYSDVHFTQEPFFYLNKIHTPEESLALFEQAKSTVMDKTGCSSVQQINQIIYENFQKGHKTKYIVTATSICSQNDERSWMNIPLKKLNSAVKASKKYVFDCFIDDNERFCFYNDASKLKDVFEEYSVDIIDKDKPNERYSFYIDYRKGILYAKVSPNDTQKVIELKPFESQEQYNEIYEQTLAKDGDASLIRASREGNVEVVKALIAAGADVNAKDKTGGTALLRASGFGNVEVVKALIAAGADVNAKDKYGYTALMTASDEGHVEVVKSLIAAGADVNAKDENIGWTALKLASEKGYEEVVKILKEAGAKE